MPAPKFQIPNRTFVSIEYPGVVTEQPESMERAIESLGGAAALSSAINSPSPSNQVELRLGSEDEIFRHPIPGDIVDSDNIVLKLTRRRRKKKVGVDNEEEGVFSVECLGLSTKIIRFRKMADFQFSPNMDDPILDLADAIRKMDVERIRNTPIRPVEETDDYGKDINIFPPPSFAGSNTVPFIYNFKQNTHSHLQTVIRPSGEEVTRLQAKSKHRNYIPHSIPFDATEVPTEPLEEHVAACKVGSITPALIDRLKSVMRERPVWTHQAFTTHLTEEENRILLNYKELRSVMAYTFSDGPFRDLHVRYGYDPRIEPEARIYQRIQLRNIDTYHMNGKAGRAQWKELRDSQKNKNVHIFDGKVLHGSVGNFQFVDILDPFITSLINAEEYQGETCEKHSGWYTEIGLECIHQAVRRKFIGLCNGIIVLDEDLQDLLPSSKNWVDVEGEGSTSRRSGGNKKEKIWNKSLRKKGVRKKKEGEVEKRKG
ncbi:hypothetical protein BT69DRAFT_1317752 [Atractiella rhizophila]|nr:hypothetical protein BT69DRAFT_1317752 [Atractiella rhizophila]